MISFNILQDSNTRQYYVYLLRGVRDYGLQPHFENSEPHMGIWGMTFRTRGTKSQAVLRNHACGWASLILENQVAGLTQVWQKDPWVLKSWPYNNGPRCEVFLVYHFPGRTVTPLFVSYLTHALLLSQDLCFSSSFFCSSSPHLDQELLRPLWFICGVLFIGEPSGLKLNILLTYYYFTGSLTHSKYSVSFQ